MAALALLVSDCMVHRIHRQIVSRLESDGLLHRWFLALGLGRRTRISIGRRRDAAGQRSAHSASSQRPPAMDSRLWRLHGLVSGATIFVAGLLPRAPGAPP